jgi:Chitobiase/beta-hexosaminidase C-terminal domain
MAMVQAVSYNFSIVENPLSDNGNFTIISDADFNGSLRVVNGNVCEPVTGNTTGGAFYSGAIAAPSNTWPADQYAELTLFLFGTANDAAYLVLRQGSATSGTQYVAKLDFSSQTWTLFAIVSGTVHTLVNAAAQASAQGDIFRLAVVGNVFTLSRNGGAVQTFTDTNNYIASGSPGFGLTAVLAFNIQTNLVAFGANQAATPTFSPNGGSFATPQTVTITSTSGGTIYYTRDNSTPTHASSSIPSGGTIVVPITQTIKAIASASNNLDSAVGSALFTITSGSGSTGAGTGRGIVEVGQPFATQINSPRTSIIGTNLKTRIL